MNGSNGTASRIVRALAYSSLMVLLTRCGSMHTPHFHPTGILVPFRDEPGPPDAPKGATPPAPPAPTWMVKADAGKRSLTFAPDRPSGTFTVRVETNIPPASLPLHELTIHVTAAYPFVTASQCETKCCHTGGDCTCLADLDHGGNSRFAFGGFGPTPAGSMGVPSGGSNPTCYLGSPSGHAWTARSFGSGKSLDPSTWTCDASTGRCTADVPFTLAARDPTGNSYTGVLQISGVKHRVVPYAPEKWPVQLSFEAMLLRAGAEAPPAGLVFTAKVLEP
jgi:hypothetical protein